MSFPEYTLPYVNENYTGPYLSDGKFQNSVYFGDAEPKSKLDALSRLHDTAYATFADYGHRTAADSIYNEEAKKLESIFPQLAGAAVLYGNKVMGSFSNLTSNAALGPLGVLIGAVKNMYNLNDYVLNEERYRRDVLDLYAKDPKKKENTVKFALDELFPGIKPKVQASSGSGKAPVNKPPVGLLKQAEQRRDEPTPAGLRFRKKRRKRRRRLA